MRSTKLILITIITLTFIGCATTQKAELAQRDKTYPQFYKEKLTTILIMPPIEKLVHEEDSIKSRKLKRIEEYRHEILYSALPAVLNNKGYYVIPPIMALQELKKDTTFNNEFNIAEALRIAKEYFNADLVLFPTIKQMTYSFRHSVQVEYEIYSTHTKEVMFSRDMTYTSTNISVFSEALHTYSYLSRQCNKWGLNDLPNGKYNAEEYLNDSTGTTYEREHKYYESRPSSDHIQRQMFNNYVNMNVQQSIRIATSMH